MNLRCFLCHALACTTTANDACLHLFDPPPVLCTASLVLIQCLSYIIISYCRQQVTCLYKVFWPTALSVHGLGSPVSNLVRFSFTMLTMTCNPPRNVSTWFRCAEIWSYMWAHQWPSLVPRSSMVVCTTMRVWEPNYWWPCGRVSITSFFLSLPSPTQWGGSTVDGPGRPGSPSTIPLSYHHCTCWGHIRPHPQPHPLYSLQWRYHDNHV